jgi:Domain of unknown function (DUF1902)
MQPEDWFAFRQSLSHILAERVCNDEGGLPMSGTILVRADWDPEAKVYVATSDDVPGLVAEAETLEALEVKLQGLVPELLELNAGVLPEGRVRDGQWTDVPMVVVSQHISKVRLHA